MPDCWWWEGRKKRDVGKEQIRTAGFKILRGKLNTLETKQPEGKGK